ncbi:MAG: Type restriction endonuclease, partial [Pseudomonadota bacterium]
MDAPTNERATQQRVLALFRDELGYRYLGNWSGRAGNSNVEAGLLSQWLGRAGGGNTPAQIARVLDVLQREARHPGRSVMENNRAVYQLLRYGVQIKAELGALTETVHLIDWHTPEHNDFAVAEEVTLRRGDYNSNSNSNNGGADAVEAGHERRPDVVLYVNGLAVAVLELKRGRVSVGEAIRQNLSNQLPEFNGWFYSTVQFVLAGNDSEGLRYGTVGTPDKFFMRWKEDEADHSRLALDKYLARLCGRARLIELMHDFVLFDGGVKKLPRVHQYFGLKAAQDHVRQRRGGILWHTQGAGKSILMVLLARWILENNPHARVALITDRDELDKQIQQVFTEAGESISRSTSGHDLLRQLALPAPRLLCSLVHKFGRRDGSGSGSGTGTGGDVDAYIAQLQAAPSLTVGEVFV